MFPTPGIALACLLAVCLVFIVLWRSSHPRITGEVVILGCAGLALALTLVLGGGLEALGLRAPGRVGASGALSILMQVGGIYLAIILAKGVLVDLVLVRSLGLRPADLEEPERKGDKARLFRELARSVTASTAEEILFRGFLLGVLVFLAGGHSAPFGLELGAVLLSAAIFGALHYRQGLAGVVACTVAGSVFGMAWLLNGGDLIPLIVAHIVINVVADLVLFAAPEADSGARKSA